MPLEVDRPFFLTLATHFCRSVDCLHISHLEPYFFFHFLSMSILHVFLAWPCNMLFGLYFLTSMLQSQQMNTWIIHFLTILYIISCFPHWSKKIKEDPLNYEQQLEHDKLVKKNKPIYAINLPQSMNILNYNPIIDGWF